MMSGTLKSFLKENNFNKLELTFKNLHNPLTKKDIDSNDFRRMAFDEIFQITLLIQIKKK